MYQIYVKHLRGGGGGVDEMAESTKVLALYLRVGLLQVGILVTAKG